MTINYSLVKPTDAFVLVDYFRYSRRLLLIGCENEKAMLFFKDESSIGVWHVKHKNQKI